MWYWNPVDCNEALPGQYDLTHCVEIEDDSHPFKTGDLPAGKVWSNDASNHPVLIDIPPPSPEDEVLENESIRSQLRATADAEIAWRQGAVETGIATEQETTELAEWIKYRVLLMRVDTTKPVWPTFPGGQAS